MQIMGEGRDSAAARKMIADERDTLKRLHCVVSRRPFVEAAVARVREVGTCTSLRPPCIRCAWLREALQQVRNRADARVRHEARPCRSGRRGCRRGPTARKWHRRWQRRTIRRRAPPLENEKPGLSFRFQAPSGVWRQIDPFEHEVGIGDEQRSFVGEPVRPHLKLGRSGVRHRDRAFDVKLTLPAVIEQAERRVAALLDLCDDEARADRVNRSGGHGNDVARRHGPPHDKIRDRAVVDGLHAIAAA